MDNAEDPLLKELGVTAKHTDHVEREVIQQVLAEQHVIHPNAAGGTCDDDNSRPQDEQAVGSPTALQRSKQLSKVRARLRAVNNEIKALQPNQVAAALISNALDAATSKGKKNAGRTGQAPAQASKKRKTDAGIQSYFAPVTDGSGKRSVANKDVEEINLVSSSDDDKDKNEDEPTFSVMPTIKAEPTQQHLNLDKASSNGQPGSAPSLADMQRAVQQQRLADLRSERQKLQEELESLEAAVASASKPAAASDGNAAERAALIVNGKAAAGKRKSPAEALAQAGKVTTSKAKASTASERKTTTRSKAVQKGPKSSQDKDDKESDSKAVAAKKAKEGAGKGKKEATPGSDIMKDLLTQQQPPPKPAPPPPPPPPKLAKLVDMDMDDLFGNSSDEGGNAVAGPGLIESERDKQIRLGLITPFGALAGFEKKAQTRAVPVASGAFDRRPLSNIELAAAGRSGKPLATLMREMTDKSRAQVVNKHKTQLLDAKDLPEPDRDVRHIPAHFWQSTSSHRHGVAAAGGGHIPNLAANRAPVPSLRQGVASPAQAAAGRPSSRAAAVRDRGGVRDAEPHVTGEGVDDVGNGDSAPSRRRRQRPRAVSDSGASDGNAPAGPKRSRRPTPGNQNANDNMTNGAFLEGEEARVVENSVQGGMVVAPGERAAARRARGKMSELIADGSVGEAGLPYEDSDESMSESDYEPDFENDNDAPGVRRGRSRRQRRSETEEDIDDEAADLEDLDLEDEDLLDDHPAGRNKPHGRGGRGAGSRAGVADRNRRRRGAASSGDDDFIAEDDSDPDRNDLNEAEEAEDLEGRCDDADDEFYHQRVAAAAARIASEDEISAAASANGVPDEEQPQQEKLDKASIQMSDQGRSQDDVDYDQFEGDSDQDKPDQDHGTCLPDIKQDPGINIKSEPGHLPYVKPEPSYDYETVPENSQVHMQAVEMDVDQGQARDADNEFGRPDKATSHQQNIRAQQDHDLEAAQEAALAELAAEGGLANAEYQQYGSASAVPASKADASGRPHRGAGASTVARREPARAAAAPAEPRNLQPRNGNAADIRQRQGFVPQFIGFDGGLRIPLRIWTKLFGYQRVGVQWLWELHCQRVGGILGDEMGLGKTIQIISYLAALHESGLWPGPVLVVCPATVMRQWLRECRRWAPQLRVVIMHESARPSNARVTGASSNAGSDVSSDEALKKTQNKKKKSALVRAVVNAECGVLLTSYEQLRINRQLLLPVAWGVVVLDEGHKIRNPDAEVTLVAKQLATPHRIVVSGSPIQNRLQELWSLFDFVYPGKLGTLPVFQAQFAIPIQVGGYTNATRVQVSTAYRCALVLRDLVAPHLLRRRKADVAIQLPEKTEQVLFCSLTTEQIELYRAYLASGDVQEILNNQRHALAGIDILRKITNHPDLLERLKSASAADYGAPERSGKLTVTMKLLQHWSEGGHKTLLFCQTQQMLDIIEKMVGKLGLRYHRMDGSTSVAMRSRLMDDFNNNPDIVLFLLTTKVGGLGVNLTGADRVLLYDPDWNPATDAQARERAWRIGQTRAVTIYRLITSGTIEEKVYHRQIYKSFLTNKVLKDPRQKRFFASRDLHDLFTLGEEYNKRRADKSIANAARNAIAGLRSGGPTETERIFGDAGHDIEVDPAEFAGPPSDGEIVEGDDVAYQNHAGNAGQRDQLMSVAVNGASGGHVVGNNPPEEAGNASAAQQNVEPHHQPGLSTDTNDGKDAARNKKEGPDAGNDDGGLVYGTGKARAARQRPATPSGLPPRPVASRLLQLTQQQQQGRSSPLPSRLGNAGHNGSASRLSDLDTSRSPSPAVVAGGAGNASSKPSDSEADPDAKGEAKIIRDLFGGAGLRSLVDHQRVESANDPEALVAEAEASRIAARAAEALKQSRAACMTVPINQPTWTGRSGTAGLPGTTRRQTPSPAPPLSMNPMNLQSTNGNTPAGAGITSGAKKRFGKVNTAKPAAGPAAAIPAADGNATSGQEAGDAAPVAAQSSASLLQQLKARKQQLAAMQEGDPATGKAADNAVPGSDVKATPGPQGGDDADLIAAEIVSYLDSRSDQNREAASTDIIRVFRKRVPESKMHLFRQLLNQVAVLNRRNGIGYWRLKTEFWSKDS